MKKIIKFDDQEIVRFCERFGVEPKLCRGIKIDIPAPGHSGTVLFDMYLAEGDLDSLGGQPEIIEASVKMSGQGGIRGR